MKLVKKENAIRHKNNENSTSFEYETGDKEINIAFVEVSGRYPERGRMYNTICKELIFVIEGAGKIFIEGKELSLKGGDTILIEPNERYYWEGSFKLLPACTPAWYIEQVKMCENI